MPKNRLWFSRMMIVVMFVIISWGLSTFSLFTQQEFRKFIGWGQYTDYEVDRAPQLPAPDISAEIMHLSALSVIYRRK
ncbi:MULTISPECIES: hypothetical protein [unclassified Bacillus (in: firmicutes)]|uniref:hypothetical protein n=1 Tax=unclassified Bacillus (in: firmicutes) TaxID=185979 RepID=UPI000B88DD25|nr:MULTISPECIES: hypothetical protein [unclassified Bacillus (in: firmicutes)]